MVAELALCLHGVFSMDVEESPKKGALEGIIFDGQKSQERDSGWERPAKKVSSLADEFKPPEEQW